MSTILVTGGAGFVGSHIVDRLVQSKNNKVIVVDDLSSGTKNHVHEDAVFYKLDIASSKLAEIFEKHKPDFVYHIAAQINVRTSLEDPLLDAHTNIIGSLQLLELCRLHGVKKVFFSSTGGAIYSSADLPAHELSMEDPLSPYAINKFAVDKYLHYYYRTWGLPYISLRFSNVYGPRQMAHGDAGVISIFIKKFLKNESPVIYGTGRQTRDYIFVADIVELAIKAMGSNDVGVFNAGTGKETSLNDLVEILQEIGDFHDIPVLQDKARKGEVLRSALDCRKAMKVFNWAPHYVLSEGLAETVGWFKGQRDA